MTGDGASASRKVRKSTAVRASKKVVPAITTGDPPPDTMRSSKSTVSTDTTGLHTSVRDSLESGRIVPYLDDLIKTLAIRSCGEKRGFENDGSVLVLWHSLALSFWFIFS